jgi:lysophospholipase L1-like esterase
MSSGLKYVLLIVLLASVTPVFAQWDEDELIPDSTMGIIDTSLIRKYAFVQYRLNKYTFHAKEVPAFERFYKKFDSLINYRKGQLNIYHIGGSHIQADIYSNKMRTYLNSFWPGLTGARGLIFPFTLAETNNPYNYRVEGYGTWEAHRNVIKKDTVTLGLLGISVDTKDSLAGFKIYYREKETMRYLHDKIKIYHNVKNASYKVEFGYPELIKEVIVDTVTGFTQFILTKEIDTAFFRITRVKSDTSRFITYGVELMNSKPGVVYNSIGVNGASLPNYLRCQDFEKQLAQLPPDLFIFSVGTNDANVPFDDFDTAVYRKNLEDLIQRILKVNPNTAILLTVPNDAYYYKKYPNKNVARIREVVIGLSAKYGFGVWDFYGVMGELGSSMTWYKEGLMHKDRIHFTWEGYNLKGDLFFEAFLKFLHEFEYKQLVKISNRNK